ncbi:MAG: condensation domain-containing protein [Acidobacteriota bacterium]
MLVAISRRAVIFMLSSVDEPGHGALPPRTRGFHRFVGDLAERRPDPAPWAVPVAPRALRLPGDAEESRGAVDTEADVDVHRRRVTGELHRRAGRVPGDASLHDVLVTALALALAPWRQSPELYLDLEHHGRGGELDFSRTVGWFTAAYPVVLRLPDGAPGDGGHVDAGRAFDTISRQLAEAGGADGHDSLHDFGVLKSLEDRPELAAAPAPEVLFNYLGRRGASRGDGKEPILQPVAGAFDGARAGVNPRAHRLEINASLDDRGLELEWIYPRTRRSLVDGVPGLADAFARELDRVLDALRRRAVDPADFPDAEDAYPLSALQEAMLIHRLEDLDADSGTLVVEATLRGPLDPDRFHRAWADTVARHPTLRTGLRWDGLEAPVQLVAPADSVAVEIPTEDWRDRADAVERARDDLRRRGLDVTRAPAMAWRLGRTGDGEHTLLWACHHLLLDGWSTALVLREVLERHAGRDPGPAPRPPKDWIAWSRRREPVDFWRDGRMEPRRVLKASPVCAPAKAGPPDLRSATARASLIDLPGWIRRHGVTFGSVAAAAWGLMLREATGNEHTSLGFTASGRGGELDGAESMVGMFTSVLPMTYRVDPQASPAKLARAVHRRQAAMQALPPRPLARLFDLGGVRLLRPPFDTLLTVANFPTSPSGSPAGEPELRLAELRGGVTSNFPLTTALIPADDSLQVEARYDARRIDTDRVEALLERFTALLETLPQEPETLADWRHLAPRKLPEPETTRQAPAAAARPLGGTGAAGPGTDTEAQLMRLWNDLMAVQEYGVDDNFFDLGGHSLLVPQMLLRIEQDFGVALPLGVVFEEATVRAIARAIDGRRGGRAVDWRPLVPIRPRTGPGGEPPLFMVHGLGGEVGWFYGLANFLDEAVPLYGLQAPPEPHDEIESMARRYLDEVRSVQSQGPYRLGGYCIGGGVAYEMARQLEAAGEQASLLVLIDSVPQAHIVDQQAAVPLAGRVKRLLQKDPREMVRSTRDFATQAARKLRSKLDSERDDRPLELDDVLDMTTLPQVYHRPSRRHFRAMRDYEPGPLGGDAWLLRTADPRFGEDFGWGPLVAGELHVERIPGRHIDVLKEPHVQVVAAKLSRALGKAS